MRRYFYFIENDKEEWHFINKKRKPKDQDIFQLDENIYHYDEWTNDPLKAERFDSIEQAETYIDTFNKRKILGTYIVTEHEFVINKV